MVVENGVSAETDKHLTTEKVNVEGSDEDVNKKEEMVGKNEQSCGNGVHEDVKRNNDTLNVCGPESEVSGIIVSELSVDGKTYNGGTRKNNKVVKGKPSVRSSIAFGRGGTRSSLTESFSFPAKGLHSDAMGKSIDVYPVKPDARQSRETGDKLEGSVSKGKVFSTSHLIAASEEKKIANSKSTENTNESMAATRRRTSGSVSNLQKSMSGRSLSANGTSNNTLTDASKPKSAVPLRADEDVHSTTSSSATPRGQRRNSIPGFSSRLEQRAEKRKEFFSKIEEKIQAREVEKNNLQAKSKEYQEAEIKQLRKSLTFKATPMPSFYKESPPKVELKKIPTTRPISPKLGRHKISTSASNHPAESGGSCLSPRVIKDQGKSPRALTAKSNKSIVTSMKPVKSAEPKPQSGDPWGTKIEGKLVKTKAKTAEAKSEDDVARVEKSVETSAQPSNNAQVEEPIDIKQSKHSAEGNEETLIPSNPENVPPELTVEC